MGDAIKVVATQNGVAQPDGAAMNALIQKVFLQADSNRSGKIQRTQLRQAIESNCVEAAVVTQESSKPSSTPVVQSIMEKLEQTSSGMIQRKDLSQAIQNVKTANNIQMNPAETEALVASIFTSADFSNEGEVSRMAIREAMEKN